MASADIALMYGLNFVIVCWNRLRVNANVALA